MTLTSHGFPVESRGLSPEQLTKLRAFVQLLQQSGSWNDRFDEHDCARFLKARNYELQAAKQMWDHMLQWRRENRVDTIHDWFDFHERADYDRVFPTGLHKTDKEGHPVLIQQLGRVNLAALYKVTTDDRIRMAHIAENEHLRRVVFPACSRTAGRPVDQLFTIIDLEGVAFTSMMRTTSLLKMFMATDSNNYPETLAHMAIINAPGWFSTSWSAVKSVLSGDTVRKIQILGKDYQAALLRHIPRENLLVEYGGLSRGRITDNEGPWAQEPIPEAPAPIPLVPPPLPLVPAKAAAAAAAASPTGTLVEAMQLSSGGDQRTPRDVSLAKRPQSPVRPGSSKVVTISSSPAAIHPAPPASPPHAKRPHYEELPQLAPSQAAGAAPGSSPAPSVSDSASDTGQSMAAPLMSNFLPSTAEALAPPCETSAAQLSSRPGSPPLGRMSGASGGAASTGTAQAVVPLGRRSSAGGSGSLVHGLVAGLQAVASHVGYHPHPHPNASRGGAASAADSGALHPLAAATAALGSPGGPVSTVQRAGPQTPSLQHQQQLLQQQHAAQAQRAGPAAGPAHLQLTSPREDTLGPGTIFSAGSAVYSPPSTFSPTSPGDSLAAADTATSRPPALQENGVVCGTSSALQTTSVTPAAGLTGSAYSRQVSGGGSGSVLAAGSVQTVGVMMQSMATGSSVYSSGVSGSMELGLSGPLPAQGVQLDTDDAESVRLSAMSQRSFYSALSHLDPSTSSGVTSPNEASERARRWSLQRELHAAAIASALAATAEQRRSNAAAAALLPAGPTVPASARQLVSGNEAHVVGTSLAMGGASYSVLPAAQQAFGSYLDQPPPYGLLRRANASFSGSSATASAGAPGGSSGGRADVGDRQCPGRHEQPSQSGHSGGGASGREAVAVTVGNDEGAAGAGGLSRSPSAATVDDCSLGAGAVRWARGWFFRRRNYGRLVESDGPADAAGTRLGGSGGSAAGPDAAGRPGGPVMTRKGSAGVLYATMQDGPGATSPSKVLPKGAAVVHHSRVNSWEWDQPSPHDSDQTYGRGGGMMQRDLSFGRGGERRRLLRSDSPGRRRGLDEYCGCLQCCTIM